MVKNINNLNPLNSLAVLKNGQLVSASSSFKISIWQKDTFELIKDLKGHSNSVNGLAVLENGNFISVSADEKIKIWDKYSLNEIFSFKTKEILKSVAFFSNDSFIIGTEKGSISIWNTKSIDLLNHNELKGHSDSVLALKFIRPVESNLILLSASEDNTIKVWDMEIFKCIQNFRTISEPTLLEGLSVSSHIGQSGTNN